MFNLFKQSAYTFEGKKEEETVILFLHRHWFVLANKVAALVALSLIPILLLVVFGQFILANNLIPLFTFLWSAYLMGLWFFLFYSLTMYTLDYWIVTNERIMDNIQHGFFNRRISELSIHMIQDISVRLVGFIPTFLNFGNVEVQTAAEHRNFFFETVPKPQLVKDKIMEIIERTEDELGPRMHGMVQRHHFHPDKYVIRRISEKTKNTFDETEPVTTGEFANDADNTFIEPEQDNIESPNKNFSNKNSGPAGEVPPNLPI